MDQAVVPPFDGRPQVVAAMSRQSQGSRRGRIAGPIACGCAVVTAAAYLAVSDPSSDSVHLPACPLFQLTGLWCPGCGMTRATRALLQGDLATAFRLNLFFPIFLAAIVVGWTAWIRRSLGRPPLVAFSRLPVWVPVAGGATLVVFGIIRNIPALNYLRG